VRPGALLAALVGLSIFCAAASDLYFIDAHSQVDDELGKLELIIRRMDEAGVRSTILAARSGMRSEEILAFAEAHPGRILPAVRTKGRAHRDNDPAYFAQLARQVESKRFRAIAEVLLYHARKGRKAPEVSVLPEDERSQAALRAAIANRWPFVIHIEFASLGTDGRSRFLAGMEKILDAHPEHPIMLNHLGQLDPREAGRLIEAHRNLYFLTAHANPVMTLQSKQPWTNMFSGETLSRDWRALVIRHPERFVFALDNVWAEHWKVFYAEQMAYWRAALNDLPPEVARAVAHGNAERLWHIPPGPAN